MQRDNKIPVNNKNDEGCLCLVIFSSVIIAILITFPKLLLILIICAIISINSLHKY
ncbi:hypothetical protein [Clostridium tagluense]|uniref:Uncharacterized protein n=1 Tax=Clostridium tagluense TaxID=360422 RepID=A0A401ULK5_9CLOT|nr:hypothetical protein [Clostridium tagluense]GCD10408.1 hypothetical protein Ctaglu_20310 [Clostridium tagluense]